MTIAVDLNYSLPEAMFIIFPHRKVTNSPPFLYFSLWKEIDMNCPYFMSGELHFSSFRVK